MLRVGYCWSLAVEVVTATRNVLDAHPNGAYTQSGIKHKPGRNAAPNHTSFCAVRRRRVEVVDHSSRASSDVALRHVPASQFLDAGTDLNIDMIFDSYEVDLHGQLPGLDDFPLRNLGQTVYGPGPGPPPQRPMPDRFQRGMQMSAIYGCINGSGNSCSNSNLRPWHLSGMRSSKPNASDEGYATFSEDSSADQSQPSLANDSAETGSAMSTSRGPKRKCLHLPLHLRQPHHTSDNKLHEAPAHPPPAPNTNTNCHYTHCGFNAATRSTVAHAHREREAKEKKKEREREASCSPTNSNNEPWYIRLKIKDFNERCRQERLPQHTTKAYRKARRRAKNRKYSKEGRARQRDFEKESR